MSDHKTCLHALNAQTVLMKISIHEYAHHTNLHRFGGIFKLATAVADVIHSIENMDIFLRYTTEVNLTGVECNENVG